MCSSGRPSCPIRTMLNCIYSISTALQKKSPAAEPARMQFRAFTPTTGWSQSQRDCSAHRPSQTQETWTCRTLPNKFFRDSRRAQILLKRWNDFLSLMVFCSFVNKIRSLWGLGCSVRHLNHTYVDMWIFAQTAICVLGPFGSRQSTWKPSVTLQNVEKNNQVDESPAANLRSCESCSGSLQLWELIRSKFWRW